MAGAKIDQAKKALKFCVNSLNPEDRFDIVRFSTEAEPLFKSLSDAGAEKQKKALAFVDDLRAAGGTAIKDALAAALDERPGQRDAGRLFMVVFLTDGEPTVGEQDPDKIIASVKDAKNGRDVRVFCFGIGNDVNTKLLDQLAEQTRAAAQYVLPNEDLEVPVSTFFAKVQDPMMTGLKLDLGTAGAGKIYPKDLPDLFKGDQLVVFGTYSKAGASAAVLTGTINGQPAKIAQDITLPESTDQSQDWIAKLWAVRRVGYLLDEIRINGESKELKEEVTELARRWGIVTPYTAMLIVEDERVRGVAAAARSLQDMEKDDGAREQTTAALRGVQAKGDVGAGAVAGSINIGGMKNADNASDFDRTAQQTDSHNQLEGRAALAHGAAAPGAPTLQPGGWAYGNGGGDGRGDVTNQGYRVVTNYAQQNRVINGKTFYLNANQWTDQSLQKTDAKAQHVKIVFASDEYFALLKDHPESAPYLALGNNVTFTLAGTVYEITEK
jgi:Ca-activated chloride channel family protein